MKEVFFFNNIALLNQCEMEAIKNNKNVSGIIYDILIDYLVNKNTDRKIKKNSRTVYLLCSEDAREKNLTIAQFIENIVKSHFDKNPVSFDTEKKKSFFNLNS